MQFDKLKNANLAKVEKAREQVKETKEELANLRMQEVFVKSIQSLAELIASNTTKTVVLNQIRDYATGEDMESLGRLLFDILKQLGTHKNTDLTPVVEVLNQAVAELQQIPKEQLDIQFPEQKDYTEAFKRLLQATQDNIKAIKALKLNVEAPVVNVEAPNVEVEAPDLKPLEKSLKESFKQAVSGIVIPKPKDYSEVLKKQLEEQKRTNKLLNELPTSSSSGSGSIAPFLINNALPTTDVALATRLDDTVANTVYIGKAPIGSSESDPVWQIAKLDTSSGLVKTWADGDASFNNVWDDRTSLTYI